MAFVANANVGLVPPELTNCRGLPVKFKFPDPVFEKTSELSRKLPILSLFAVNVPTNAPVNVIAAFVSLIGLFGVQPGPLVQVSVPLVALLVTLGTKTTGAAVMTTSCVAEFTLVPFEFEARTL